MSPLSGLYLGLFLVVSSFDATSCLLLGGANNTRLLAPVSGLLSPILPGLAKVVDTVDSVVGGVLNTAVDLVGKILPEILGFTDFLLRFDKNYSSPWEKQRRENIYKDNLKIIQQVNDLESSGQLTYRLGVNQYSDLTPAEFVQLRGFRSKTHSQAANQASQKPSSPKPPTKAPSLLGGLLGGLLGKKRRKRYTAPLSVNWRTKGYVTDVEDQGRCGSCYAFATAASIEGQYYKKYRELVPLSVQTIVTCSEDYGNYGCYGGDMENVYKYMQENGVLTQTECPYDPDNTTNWCCPLDSGQGIARVKSYVELPAGDEEALKVAVATIGPITSAVDASSEHFQFYRSGVLDSADCTQNIDHGIAIVGYGTKNGTDYWIIKNSWGISWGMAGYAYIARNQGNRCGVASYATYPILE